MLSQLVSKLFPNKALASARVYDYAKALLPNPDRADAMEPYIIMNFF